MLHKVIKMGDILIKKGGFIMSTRQDFWAPVIQKKPRQKRPNQ